MRSKKIKSRIINLFLITEILVIIALIFYFKRDIVSDVIDEFTAVNAEPVTIRETGSEQLLLEWPSADEAQSYQVEIFSDDQNYISESCTETYCFLKSDIPEDKKVTIRIRYKVDGKFHKYIEAKTYINIPDPRDVVMIFDSDNKKLSFKWKAEGNDDFTLLINTGEGDNLGKLDIPKSSDSYEVTTFSGYITFGDKGSYPLPPEGEQYLFELESTRTEKNIQFVGMKKKFEVVSDGEFLHESIRLFYSVSGENYYNLTWTEVSCDGYEIQEKAGDASDDEWETIATTQSEEACSYDTDRLPPGKEICFRVLPIGVAGEWTNSNTSVVHIKTDAFPDYATIWPTSSMEVFSDTDKNSTVGKVTAMEALCVLEEKDGFFKVKTDSCEGYINSNYCFINLPEYLGDLCAYDITNSYASIYLVHDYAIPEVSARVIPGYENILLDDDTFVVPLLYPCAVKLESIAKAALEDGYRIKIYDSFRPYEATRYIYDETAKRIDLELPDATYERITLSAFRQLQAQGIENAYETVPEDQWPVLPEETDEATADGSMDMAEGGEAVDAPAQDQVSTDVASAESSLDQTMSEEMVIPTIEDVEGVPEAADIMTYRRMMLSGGFSLGSFLAARGSTHNLGIAMDLTLETMDGEELKAQTNMHDLSHFSILSQNNDMANMLSEYMVEGGYATLVSEWWHFQDDATRALYRPASIQKGVSIEGWKYDGKGWKYRLPEGDYYANITAQINGKDYSFDAKGYANR
ncbi:hypothetical protein [Butyrivibrio sp. VCB2006]|uniref:hypothetical protein n=1 Tax=Butyrivibrio sp. VCB2006 TaxID=1280679 RepID=UPI0003F63B23|nr:hypothetical protein [Butyrivibrio sp. VCB2006]